jgi:predicted metal-binding protein
MPSRSKSNGRRNPFQFLLSRANDLGATDAKIIPSGKIVVEDRVLLKCKSGYHMYGHKLVCPPFTPTPDEFRKMLTEYQYALIVKFEAKAEAEEDVGRSLLKNLCVSDISPTSGKGQRYFGIVGTMTKDRSSSLCLNWKKLPSTMGTPLPSL